MGNRHQLGNSSWSLANRLRYNDKNLIELGLTEALRNEEELDAVIWALPRNRTVVTAVFFDAFSAQVLHCAKWRAFVEALASVSSLVQVEFMETRVPLYTMGVLMQNPKLETLAITDGIELGTITPTSIHDVASVFCPNFALEEFVWECEFEYTQHILDPFLSSLSQLPRLKLLGLINSRGPSSSPVPLLSPECLATFCRKRCLTLETLDLSGCGLTDEHIKGLVGALKSQPDCTSRLQNLHLLRNCATTSDSLKVLLELVRANQGLWKVTTDDATGEELKDQLELWLLWNQQVAAPLGPTPSRQSLGRMAIKLAETVEFLYLLLQEYPEVCCSYAI
jgi:hypothetical protein